MIPKDPTDERLRERTAASFVISAVIHALLLLFFVSVVTSSSEQSSPESSEGSPVVILSHVAVSRRTKSVPPVVQPQVTHALRTGKPMARPVLAGHPPVPAHRELAKQNPSAPPNPTPAPQVPFSPNPQPSQVAIVTPAPAQIPAVETNVPTAPPLIAPQRHATAPPTVAPPTAAPTAKPSAAPAPQSTAKALKASPQPSAAPSAQPTKAPVAATAAPVKAPATSAPRQVAASPQPQKSAPGIASPAPTGAPSPSAQRGQNPSPGPKPLASSGQVPVKAKPAPARPISLPPTPTPQPTLRPTPRPRPAKTPVPLKAHAASSLNDRLRALIPNGPVDVHVSHYTPKNIGYFGYPTPPPDVVAATKFIYEDKKVKGIFKLLGGREQRTVMYVTSVTRHGPVSTCTGWLIRYPLPSAPYRSSDASGPFHGGGVAVDNPGPAKTNGYVPVVEKNVTFECETARLKPFVPGSEPSPGP